MLDLKTLDSATKLAALRREHPRFAFTSYAVEGAGNRLRFAFEYEVEGGPSFRPELFVEGFSPETAARIDSPTLRNFAFHLGLMEMPSYWKATASPEIVVEAGYLDAWQLDWWTRLLLNGMGEFFFVNNIDFTTPGFIEVTSTAPPHPPARYLAQLDGSSVLVPVGGGKDSAVTCELLSGVDGITPVHFTVNPTPASLALIELAGGTQTIRVQRNIDPALLDLNSRGFLNGHTPFSAVLAFLSATCAVLDGTKFIAFSNEQSADEGNVWYRGHEINHQYSKTPEFEAAFRDYTARYLVPGLEYFSLLRPLSELQIAGIFAGLDRYMGAFRSCNRGQKTNTWCGACPKCLSVFTLLYPFTDEILTVFGRNLLDDATLLPIASGLMRPEEVKPFECVGTREENLVAFQLCLRKSRARGADPALLKLLDADLSPSMDSLDPRAQRLLSSWSPGHFIPAHLEPTLRDSWATLRVPC